jgi:hypothetical protein
MSHCEVTQRLWNKEPYHILTTAVQSVKRVTLFNEVSKLVYSLVIDLLIDSMLCSFGMVERYKNGELDWK